MGSSRSPTPTACTATIPGGSRSIDVRSIRVRTTSCGSSRRSTIRTAIPGRYQLAAIELGSYGKRYPHTAPTGLPPEAPAWAGFAIFRSECIACHAINGEGGTIGPELNVPQSIVEYRPEEQLKAYIRKPEAFRYTSMPSHEHLTSADLDAVIAYFRAMRDRKHDPKAASRAEAP